MIEEPQGRKRPSMAIAPSQLLSQFSSSQLFGSSLAIA
jgi:hypothetical protein